MKRFGRLIALLIVCMLMFPLLGKGTLASGAETVSIRIFQKPINVNEEDTYRESLDYALYAPQNTEESISLNIREIIEEYGKKVRIQSTKSLSEKYSVSVPDENGIVRIKQTDHKYVIIEDYDIGKTLWAGEFCSEGGIVPDGIVFRMYSDPTFLLAYIVEPEEGKLIFDGEPKSLDKDEENGEEIFEHNGIEWRYTSRKGAGDAYTVELNPVVKGQNIKVLYLYKSEAGESTGHYSLDVRAIQSLGGVAVLDEKDQPIGEVNRATGLVELRETGWIKIVRGEDTLWEGELLPQENEKDRPEPDISDPLTFTGDIKKAMEANRVDPKDSESTDSLESQTRILLTMTEDSVVRVNGMVTLTGVVQMPNGGVSPDDLELYVDGAQVADLELEPLPDGAGTYAFSAKNYIVNEKAAELTVYVRQAGNPDQQSESVKVKVKAPEKLMTVTIVNCNETYNGRAHIVRVTPNVKGASIYYAENDPASDGFSERDWKKEALSATDVGEKTVYIIANHDDYAVEYRDGQGKLLELENDYVKAKITIVPAPVNLKIMAGQAAGTTYTYNGEEQNIPGHYAIEVVEDASGLFDLAKMINDDRWKSISENGAIAGMDAGTYSLGVSKAQFEFLKEIDTNFAVDYEVVDEGITIAPKPLVLTSASAAAVYGAFTGALREDSAVEGVQDIVEGCFSGDVMAKGAQAEVGVSKNEIYIAPTSAFYDKQHNYAFDLEAGAGVLVVFPQSISDEGPDSHWDNVKGTIKPEDFAGDIPENLPGYYLGMQVTLEKPEQAEYTGEAQKKAVSFWDSAGNPVNMVAGRDYEVAYFRNGEETTDFISAGFISVQVTGKGNYTGTVTQRYEIKRAVIQNASVSIADWVYDGKPAGSISHPVKAAGNPEYVYRDAQGVKIDPPCNAGGYTVQAKWAESGNYLGKISEPYAFTIHPAPVTVDIRGNQKTVPHDGASHSVAGWTAAVTADSSGLFDEKMIEYAGSATQKRSDVGTTAMGLSEHDFSCSDANFHVNFNVVADGSITVTKADIRNLSKEVFIESWVYDGTAANSENHKITFTSDSGAKPAYRYMNSSGEEIEAPRDVGSYKVIATWAETDNYPEFTAERRFDISQAKVKLTVKDSTKIFGDIDPEFIEVCEGVCNDDIIVCEKTREPGEDVGNYAIMLSGAASQGNYLVTYVPGTLTILPQVLRDDCIEPIDDVTFNGKPQRQEPCVTDSHGNALKKDVDYTVEYNGDAVDPGEIEVIVNGRGNYAGTGRRTYAIVPAKITLVLKDVKGNDLPGKGITPDQELKVSFRGIIEPETEVEASYLSVYVDGRDAQAALTPIEGSRAYAFSVKDYALTSKDTAAIEVTVKLNDGTEFSQTLPIYQIPESLPWLILMIGMVIGAVVSLMLYINTTNKLKRERYKLLDKLSLQSRRTIRQPHE